jgi:hypothetical protein
MTGRPIPKDFDEMRVQFSEYATHQDYLVKKVDELDGDVKEIKKLVFQVKWAIVGAAAVVVAAQTGLITLFMEVVFK